MTASQLPVAIRLNNFFRFCDSKSSLPATRMFAPVRGVATGVLIVAVAHFSREPGYWNVDFLLSKRFRFGDHYAAQFRLEAYNLFNQIEWTTLNAALTFTGTTNVQSSTTAGQYGTVINPRQIGLSLRFDF